MSRCPAKHAKITSRYEGRHIKPGAPPSAALIGTAKALPASLVAGAAGSALVLSGTASAATAPPAGLVHAGSDLAPVKVAATGSWVTQGRHAAHRSSYTVVSGDTLSGISARFCGTSADYPSLAAASGISNPDAISPGQHIRLSCHHKHGAFTDGASSSSGSGAAEQSPPPQQQAPATVSSGGMSAFESCVISAESGGNPAAVNPSSGAGGLFQFLPSTWASLGYAGQYPGGAQTAPASVQEAAFAQLYAEAGTSPWAPYDGC